MHPAIRIVSVVVLLASGIGAAVAELKSQTVEYRDADVPLRGYLVWDDSVAGKRPGVIVVHEWWGLNDYARKRADMLAELGYVALAVDMYGEGRSTTHPEQAGEWSKQISANVEQWQRRGLLGLEVLRQHKLVEPSRLAAIGYCFGGATVMQMAYSGANLAGVVSFHGSLPVASAEQGRAIKAKVLVAHGAADSFVPAERVAQFQSALDAAGVDWTMVTFGGAKHGFTNPDAGQYGMENLRYDEVADRRSWEYMRQFFAEIFGTDK